MSERVVCGIEVHQQLDTGKLFCRCRSELSDEGEGAHYRRLRPTAGETGKMDRAALVQFRKGIGYRYQTCNSSCLVDLDEEPPGSVDGDAMDTALTFASMIGSNVADEVHFMRKVVVDGSNTTGFQRTALISTGGSIDVGGRNISILSVCLEEDAARKMSETDGETTYRLDRLGIPLIEIATGPDIRSPEEAMEAALKIGTMLRATKRVKRGIGTIREDLNISIPGGSRVELKGVQELRLLPAYVENEIARQKMLLTIRDILKKRKAAPADIDIADVTDVFADCPSKVISSALSSKGKVLAVRLPKFAGVMNGDGGKLRLGSEMAQRARTKGVKGIFHSDELPGYGIGEEYVNALRTSLGTNEKEDAFVICAASSERAKEALIAAAERANEALEGVPEETRDPMPDGTSRYSRPLPGAARMYPETDVPPIAITEERMARIRSHLPELPEQIQARLVKEYGVNEQQARQLVRQGDDGLFETIAKRFGMIPIAVTTLLNTLPEIGREMGTGGITEDVIFEAFEMLRDSRFSKEALISVFREAAKGIRPEDAVSILGLEAVSSEDAADIIAKVVKERILFVKEKGMAAVGPLMGPVMEALRGRIDGKEAAELLKKEITNATAQ